MICTTLFAHSLESETMETIFNKRGVMVHKCSLCGYEEELPFSRGRVFYTNNLVQQHKQYAADETRKETLQPTRPDGSINDEFTEAYGYNPFDPSVPNSTPYKAA